MVTNILVTCAAMGYSELTSFLHQGHPGVPCGRIHIDLVAFRVAPTQPLRVFRRVIVTDVLFEYKLLVLWAVSPSYPPEARALCMVCSGNPWHYTHVDDHAYHSYCGYRGLGHMDRSILPPGS